MLRFLQLLFVADNTLQQDKKPVEKCTVPTLKEFQNILLKEYCTRTDISNTNKPNTLQIGMHEGEAYPVSCFSQAASCNKETEEWQEFFNSNQNQHNIRAIETVRKKFSQEFTSWTQKLS